MAKKEPTELAPVAPAGALAARPNFIGTDAVGTEHIGKDDLQMPRLGLAQALSPQLNPDDPKFVPGLAQGDMFNNLTGRIIGRGPLELTVVRADRPRGIEFYPLDQGGGIKDFNVPLTDPRMQFGPNGEKPIATKFYDYVVLLLGEQWTPEEALIALSLKGSGLKVARQLNTLITLRHAPLYAGKYTLTTVKTTNKLGTFYIFQVRNSGTVDAWTSNPGWVSSEVFAAAKVLHASIKDKELKIEREPGEDDDVPLHEGM